jgi:hypothetical protein
MATSEDLIRLYDVVSGDPVVQAAVVQTKQDTITLVDTRVGELDLAINQVAAQQGGGAADAYTVAYQGTSVGAALDQKTDDIADLSIVVGTQGAAIASVAGDVATLQTDVISIQGLGVVGYLARGNHTGTQLSSTISDFAAAADARISAKQGVAFGIAPLDGSLKIDPVYLPPIAITETFVVADQAARLALTCEVGDIAIQTDVSLTYILVTSPPSTLANWQQLLVPGAGVTSVDLAMPAQFAVTGNPITSTGTLTTAWQNQTINTVLAGPALGSPGVPTFRTLVSDDIPSLDGSKIGSGVISKLRLAETAIVHAEAIPLVNVNTSAPGITFDNWSPTAGERILLINQTAPSQNGPWVFNGGASPLTRPDDYSTGSSLQATYGMFISIQHGDVYAGTTWLLDQTGVITIDTTGTTWTQANRSLTQGTVGILPVGAGGTGLNLASAANGSLLIGNGTGMSSATLTAGTGITITNSVGGITVANSTLTTTQVANSFLAGPTSGGAAAPTFRAMVAADLPTVPLSKGGTGLTSNPTAGAILVGNNTNDGWNISSVVGTVNQVNVAASGAGISLSLPQDIHTGASPTFANLTVTTLLTAGAQVLGRASVTTTYAVAAAVSTVFADATGGAFTVTLPSAVANAGRIIRIKRTSTANNTVTVASAAGNVEGAATYGGLSGNGPRPSATFASDGTNWWLVGAS